MTKEDKELLHFFAAGGTRPHTDKVLQALARSALETVAFQEGQIIRFQRIERQLAKLESDLGASRKPLACFVRCPTCAVVEMAEVAEPLLAVRCSNGHLVDLRPRLGVPNPVVELAPSSSTWLPRKADEHEG